MIALPRDVDPLTSSALAVWRADPRRHIEIGGKYRANAAVTYCWTGCGECRPGTPMRCWQRRTELEFVYRVQRLEYTDYAHGLGRLYLVTLVRPGLWQMRAFMTGVRGLLDESDPGTWHQQTGVVAEAQLGEVVK